MPAARRGTPEWTGRLDRFSVYYAGFSAAHRGGVSHTTLTTETRQHGHDWRVTVECKSDESALVEYELDHLAAEFRGRILEDMMPGASTTATGIASWLMERLSMKFPEVVRVDVQAAGHHGYATREPRRMA